MIDKKIFESNYVIGFNRLDIHPDGDRFIMIQLPEIALETQHLFVIENFLEELKRLVPVGRD